MEPTTVSMQELRTNMLTFHLVRLLSELFSSAAFPGMHPVCGVLQAKEGFSPWPDTGLLSYSDGCGQCMTIGWNAAGVVGLVFDHESCNSEAAGGDVQPEDYRPLQWFEGSLPPPLLPLATSLARTMGNLTTAGFFATGEGPLAVTSSDSRHTHDWFGVLTEDFEAELHSILPEQRDLCQAVARDLRKSRRALSEQERSLLLRVPPEWAEDQPPRPDAAVLAKALALVGVDWGT